MGNSCGCETDPVDGEMTVDNNSISKYHHNRYPSQGVDAKQMKQIREKAGMGSKDMNM